MKRSEVLAWLDAHRGQKNIEYEYVKVPNPKYNPGAPKQTAENSTETLLKKQVTWTANDGKQLSVIDDSPPGSPDPDKMPPGVGYGAGPVRDNQYPAAPEPDYQVVAVDKQAPRDTSLPVQSPYQAARDDSDLKEAQTNAAAGKGFYTDAQLAERSRQGSAESRAEEDQQMQRDARLRQIAIDERAATTQAEANKLAKERLDLERQNAAASNTIASGNLAVNQSAEARQQAQANRPQFLSTADPANKNIASFDPTTGQITSVENPNYDAVKAEAQQVQQELTLGIQLNNYTAQEAKQKYDQWFAENVTVPFQAAAEERQRAADQRQAEQAAEQSKQFAAQFGLSKAQFGQKAGQDAAQNEIATLPYRVGPNFGPDMSSAINSLAAGGDISGPSPSAGIHFSPGDFTYNKPDFQSIAQKATAKALAHLGNFSPTTNFTSVGAGGVPAPNFSAAPQASPAVPSSTLTNMFNSMIGKYSGPAAAPTPPPAPDPAAAAQGQARPT